jgi:hypothetical protein
MFMIPPLVLGPENGEAPKNASIAIRGYKYTFSPLITE